MRKKIISHIMLNRCTHNMPIILYGIRNNKFKDIKQQQNGGSPKKHCHVFRRKNPINKFSYHDRKNQIKPCHGKSPNNYTDKQFHIRLVIVHKVSNHYHSPCSKYADHRNRLNLHPVLPQALQFLLHISHHQK